MKRLRQILELWSGLGWRDLKAHPVLPLARFISREYFAPSLLYEGDFPLKKPSVKSKEQRLFSSDLSKWKWAWNIENWSGFLVWCCKHFDIYSVWIARDMGPL